jgi:hypothetical protein
MLRYKVFDSAEVGGDLAQLEAAVNDWLREQQPRVRLLAQSPRGDQIVLSFVFEQEPGLDHRLALSAGAAEGLDASPDELDQDPDEAIDPRLPEAELPY